MDWNRENLAWVAGVIEGEGHVRANWRHSSRTPQLLIVVSMTDLDILLRLQEYTGMGHITGPRQRGTNKPFWCWQVSKNSDAYALMVALYQWMGVRRQLQVRTAIQTWVETHRQVGAQRNSAPGRSSTSFCRKELHFDEQDRGTQSNGRGSFCKACKRDAEHYVYLGRSM